MSDKTYSLTIEKTLSATPEMIFDAWLDKDNIGKWLQPGEGITVPNPQIDPVVGGKFSLAMQVGENLLPHFGEYKKIDRAKELQFTWVSEHGTNNADTLVYSEDGRSGFADAGWPSMDLRGYVEDTDFVTQGVDGIHYDLQSQSHMGNWKAKQTELLMINAGLGRSS